MSDPKKNYWFPAKKYGWGWGFPSTWQGWLVFLVFLAVMITLPNIIDLQKSLGTYLLSVTGTSLLLILISYLKGEPPKWRWGSSEKEK